jgi:hypothetical protein
VRVLGIVPHLVEVEGRYHVYGGERSAGMTRLRLVQRPDDGYPEIPGRFFQIGYLIPVQNSSFPAASKSHFHAAGIVVFARNARSRGHGDHCPIKEHSPRVRMPAGLCMDLHYLFMSDIR